MRTLKASPGLAAVLALMAPRAFAQAAALDPQLAVVPVAQRLTLSGVFSHATVVVQLVFAALIVALAVSAALWIYHLLRRGQAGLRGAVTWLSAVGRAAPLLGWFGSAYALMNSFIGIANVRPAPSLSILAPGLAEASLSTGLGLLAAAVAVIGHRHLQSKLPGHGVALQTVASGDRVAPAAHARLAAQAHNPLPT